MPAPAADSSPAARIGVLGPPEEPRFSNIVEGLRQGLREHGYAEANLQMLERRAPRGDPGAARSAARALTDSRPALLFVIGSELARVVREVSREVPVVFLTPGDPVAAGLVTSLARPGGNMTGMTFEYPELSGKRLELLRETLPALRRVLALYDGRDASPRQGLAAARAAVAQLRLALIERDVRTPEDLRVAIESAGNAEAVLVIPGGFPSGSAEEIVRLASSRRLPTMLHTHAAAEALVSYGAGDVDVARQAARLVDRIVRGADAGSLPVERPSTLRLVINRRTARALGLTIPPAVLGRADRLLD
jgi:putative ABC transport system substrate-binding protein